MRPLFPISAYYDLGSYAYVSAYYYYILHVDILWYGLRVYNIKLSYICGLWAAPIKRVT